MLYLYYSGPTTAAVFNMAVSRANAYYAVCTRCVFLPGATDAELAGRLFGLPKLADFCRTSGNGRCSVSIGGSFQATLD